MTNNFIKEIQEEASKSFIEEGASLEHERWAGWQKYLHGLCIDTEIVAPESDSMRFFAKAFHKDLYDRWERQIKTPYSKLTDKEKESDRKEVRKYLPLINSLITHTALRTIDFINEKYGNEFNDGCGCCMGRRLGSDLEKLKSSITSEQK